MKNVMFALLALAISQSAHAGFRFNHVIYDCTLATQSYSGPLTALNANIYEPAPTASDAKRDLEGQWLVIGNFRSATSAGTIWGGSEISQGWFNSDVVTLKERAEILGEEPSSLALSLNLKTLMGEITYKKWSGYAPIGSPRIKFTAPVICRQADKYID